MPNRPDELEYPRQSETVHVWSERLSEWITAYRTNFIQQYTHPFVDGVTFDSANETFTSREFHVAPFQKFLLLIDLDVTGTPTDIRIDVQFSDDRVHWYKLMRGPFGDLRYEDAAGDKVECIDGVVLAPWMRLYIVSSGCDAQSYFKLTCKAILNG